MENLICRQLSRKYSFTDLVKALCQHAYNATLTILTMLYNLMPLLEGFMYLLRFMLDKLIDIFETPRAGDKAIKSALFVGELVILFFLLYFIISILLIPIIHFTLLFINKIFRATVNSEWFHKFYIINCNKTINKEQFLIILRRRNTRSPRTLVKTNYIFALVYSEQSARLNNGTCPGKTGRTVWAQSVILTFLGWSHHHWVCLFLCPNHWVHQCYNRLYNFSTFFFFLIFTLQWALTYSSTNPLQTQTLI